MKYKSGSFNANMLTVTRLSCNYSHVRMLKLRVMGMSLGFLGNPSNDDQTFHSKSQYVSQLVVQEKRWLNYQSHKDTLSGNHKCLSQIFYLFYTIDVEQFHWKWENVTCWWWQMKRDNQSHYHSLSVDHEYLYFMSIHPKIHSVIEIFQSVQSFPLLVLLCFTYVIRR